jgi:hypothetical protein
MDPFLDLRSIRKEESIARRELQKLVEEQARWKGNIDAFLHHIQERQRELESQHSVIHERILDARAALDE